MSNVKKITYGGIFAAITVLLLYVSYIIPTSKLTLLTIISAIIPLSVSTTGIKNTLLVYLVSSLLSFILGLREMSLVYLLFFGLYGIVKFYIEKLSKLPLEIILKLLFFNIDLGIIIMIMKLSLFNFTNMNLPVYVIIIFLQIVFLIYDYCLTLIISYISKRLKLTDKSSITK